MNEVKIRRAEIEDAEMLADLSYKTFWDAFHEHPENAPEDMAAYMEKAFSVETLRAELKDEKVIFLIAEFENESAGYAKITLGAIEDKIIAENPIELNRLYSHQKFLGKGIGQKLMDECFRVAKENDCDVMWLGVWEFNPRAQAFYKRYGFREVGKHIFQLGSDPQTDLLMQRDLI
jgi:ribosomal protein S18 acetylase RimI-like enzyme